MCHWLRQCLKIPQCWLSQWHISITGHPIHFSTRTQKGHRCDTGAAKKTHRQGTEGRGSKGRRDESEGKGLSQQVDREPIVPEISSLIFASVSLEKASRMTVTSFS